MKLYAIRDRLLNYYMQPFAGPSDNQVMAAVATTVNTENESHGLYTSPHHFEIWRLAHIQENGEVIPDRELVCTCDSLVRGNIREANRPETGNGYRPIPGAKQTHNGKTSRTPPNGGTLEFPTEPTVEAEKVPTDAAPGGPSGPPERAKNMKVS